MPIVHFTSALQRFFPDLDSIDVPGETVSEIVHSLNERFPNLAEYLVDERGELRKHVNIYIGEELIQDRKNLEDEVNTFDELLIFQALSGG